MYYNYLSDPTIFKICNLVLVKTKHPSNFNIKLDFSCKTISHLISHTKVSLTSVNIFWYKCNVNLWSTIEKSWNEYVNWSLEESSACSKVWFNGLRLSSLVFFIIRLFALWNKPKNNKGNFKILVIYVIYIIYLLTLTI